MDHCFTNRDSVVYNPEKYATPCLDLICMNTTCSIKCIWGFLLFSLRSILYIPSRLAD